MTDDRAAVRTVFERTPTLPPVATKRSLKLAPLACSRCGLCYTDHRDAVAEACVFVESRIETMEERLHGRGRVAGTDEDVFGIHRGLHIARMRQPLHDAQWSGMVSTLGAMLLERGMVDGVIVVGAQPDKPFAPAPYLATTPDGVKAARGLKPALSPNLQVLDEIERAGLRRVAFIGNGCQTHALRALQMSGKLALDELYFIGMPCTDNVTYSNLVKFLRLASDSPDTVMHYEFMPDYRIWMKHTDGRVEKLSYFGLGAKGIDNTIFPDSCMSCFDYANALSDITIGYLGAAMPYQWTLVRTEQGQKLFDMLKPHLEWGDQPTLHAQPYDLSTLPAGSTPPAPRLADPREATRAKVIAASIKMLDEPIRKLPRWFANLLSYVVSKRGMRGIDFARATITMKFARNLHFVRRHYPAEANAEARLVPSFARRILKKHGM